MSRRVSAPDATAMPQGLPPERDPRVTRAGRRVDTDTSPDGPLAVYTVWPSGLMPMPHGRVPTSANVRVTCRVATSITETDRPRPLETNNSRPSGDSTAPMGRGGPASPAGPPGMMFDVTVCVATSTTDTAFPVSPVTNIVAPSSVKTIERGRLAVGTRAMTARVDVSIPTTVPSASDVT